MARKKEIDYSKISECDVIVNYINRRLLQKGLNINIYVIGLSGTGKSSTSLKIAEKINESRENNIQIQIVDSLLDLLRAIRSSKEGDVIIIEEVSVLFPSRRAMAKENVNIGKIMDTCRKKGLCIISNAPLWNSIDSHMRAMGHLLIETLKINKKHGVVISKFHRLQTNPLTGKTYRHTMQRKGRDVNRLITSMPNKERWEEYERSKDIFMDDLYKRMEFEQNKKKKKLDEEMQVGSGSIKELTVQEIRVHQLRYKERLTQRQIADRMELSQTRIAHIIKNIKKKTEITKENTKKHIIGIPMLPTN
ncbi:MAG TPA: hypothetical protein ENH99_03255 [Candidatus Pacearchaeota archaeon]|nr:hypothetical protein [Candidatus Pacearchaeota archaeon]